MADLFSIEKGKVGIKAAVPGKHPLVTTAEHFLSHKEAHFSGDAVVIPMISATGHGHASIKRLHHVRGTFAVGSILCACIAKDESLISARYVYLYLSAMKDTLLVPLMQGSANVSLKLVDIAKIEIPLPPLSEQLAIIAKLDSLSDKVCKLDKHLDAVEADAERLLSLRFREAIRGMTYRPMSDVAPVTKRPVELETDRCYREVGARSFGKGLFAKPDFSAADATWEKPVWIKPGDIVFSNIKAWEGAIALAGTEHEETIASHRYITCVPSDELLASFLLYYLLSEEGLQKIGQASAGTADRNRTLSITKLAKLEVPVPPLEAQREFTTLQFSITALKAKHAAIRKSSAALFPASLERIFTSLGH